MNFSLKEIQDFNKLTNIYPYKHLFFVQDIILIPIFLGLIFIFLKYKKKQQPFEIQEHYIRGYFVRLFGIGLFLIHHILIYQGGVDSFTYYWASNQLYTLFQIAPVNTLKIIFSNYDTYDPNNFNLDLIQFIFTSQESVVIKIATLLSFFCFNSFTVISLLLGLFAYGGCWRIYKVFYELFPHLSKPLAITCLYIPSVIFWSSVISKEIICIGAMGYFFHSFYSIFFKRRKILIHSILLLVCGWLLFKVKVYIILAFVPSILLLILLSAVKKIRSVIIRSVVFPIVLLFFVVLIYTSLDSISSSIANFSLDTIVESARITYVYLTQEGFAESRYTLGEFDASAGGILKLVPAGINVTLFRPYLWEANKPVTLIAALESLITLILTLYIVLKVGVFNVFRKINNHPIILFCIFFAIIFSLSVGITSGNFGTLMRYKIPMMPFYFTALVLIYKLPTNKFSAS